MAAYCDPGISTNAMNIYGCDFAERMLASNEFLFKCVANESGVAFFAHMTEHREIKHPGLSYEDDSGGNALAAMVKPGLIEFRFHRQFSDDRVRNIARAIVEHPGTPLSPGITITYQGRVVLGD